jgi:DNA polymerase-4
MNHAVIMHLDADAFFASVEQAADRHLRNRPVVVGGEHRGIVASASYEARSFGIRTPMPIARARRMCNQLVIVPPRFELYEQFSENIFGMIEELSPLVERQSIDEGYVDLTGLSTVMKKDPETVADTLRHNIQDWLKVTVSQGLARNKLLSQIASKLHKPNGLTRVHPNHELAFLHPLSPRWLPGIGEVGAGLLQSAGLARIGQVACMPLGWLRELFGQQARQLRDFARNIDDRAVVPRPTAAQSYGHQHTFPEDTVDMAFVDATLRRLTDQAVIRMRQDGKQARTIAVKLRYTDMAERQGQMTLAEPCDVETLFYPLVTRLRTRLWDRRVRLRMVHITVSRIYSGFSQLDLFGHKQRDRALAVAAQCIRDKFGSRALMRSHSLHLEGVATRETSAPHP